MRRNRDANVSEHEEHRDQHSFIAEDPPQATADNNFLSPPLIPVWLDLNVPLYDTCRCSIGQLVLCAMAFSIRYQLSWAGLEDQLRLMFLSHPTFNSPGLANFTIYRLKKLLPFSSLSYKTVCCCKTSPQNNACEEPDCGVIGIYVYLPLSERIRYFLERTPIRDSTSLSFFFDGLTPFTHGQREVWAMVCIILY